MARVFGLQMIRLKPGVKTEDFEEFVKEEVSQGTVYEGWQAHVLKGLRGDREGRYLWMWEIESVEALNRYFPGLGPETETEEAKRFHETHADEMEQFMKKWDTFATPFHDRISTDYVVVE